MKFLYEIIGAVLDGATGEFSEYRHLINKNNYRQVWGKLYGNEIGRLEQGIPGKVEGTNNIVLMEENEVSRSRKRDVTYGRIEIDVIEGKE